MPTLEMNVFSPSSRHVFPSLRAVARSEATSLPASGSVSAKPPTVRPASTSSMRDRQRSTPARTSGCDASPCTAKMASAIGDA